MRLRELEATGMPWVPASRLAVARVVTLIVKSALATPVSSQTLISSSRMLGLGATSNAVVEGAAPLERRGS